MADFNLSDIFSEIDRQATQFGVNPTVAKALLVAENTGSGSLTGRSSYSGTAVSSAGAQGLMQVMPATAKGLQQAGLLPQDWKHDPTNIGSQVSAGLAAIKDIQSRQRDPSDFLETASYYNGGNAGGRAYSSGTLRTPETVQYLQKVKRAAGELGMQPTPQQIEQMASTKTGATQALGGTSSSITSSRSVFAPGVLEGLAQSLGTMQGAIDDAVTGVGDRAAAQQSTGLDWMNSIMQAGQAAGTVATVKATEEAAATAVRAQILKDSNLYPSVQGNRMQQALSQMDDTSAKIDRLRPAIDERLQASIFDNPLSWLAAQIQLPGMVAEHNNLVRVQQDAIGRYDTASSIAAKQISLGTAIQADKVLETGAAQAKADVAKADATQKQVAFQLASKVAADKLQAVQLGMQGLTAQMHLANLQRERETVRTGESERQAATRALQGNVDDINMVIQAAGGQGNLDIARFKAMPAQEREQLAQQANNKKFGTDLAGSITFISQYGSLAGMAEGGQNGVVNWVKKAVNQGTKSYEEARKKAIQMQDKSFKPEKALSQAINEVGNKYQLEADSDLRTATEGNPFKLDYSLAATRPELKTNLVTQIINKYGPDSPQPLYPKIDEQLLVQRALAEISNTPKAQSAAALKQWAADIANFYKTATAAQAAETKYTLFGFTKPQKTYAVSLPEMMSSMDTVDLGNPTAVENLLTRQFARNSSIMHVRGDRNPFGLIN